MYPKSGFRVLEVNWKKLVECKLNKGFFFLLPQFCSTPCIMHNYVFNVCIPSNYYLMSHDCTIIISVMEFPACFLVIILLLKAGRRLTLLILYLICGFSLLATMAIPEYVLSNNRVWVRGRKIGHLNFQKCLCTLFLKKI